MPFQFYLPWSKETEYCANYIQLLELGVALKTVRPKNPMNCLIVGKSANHRKVHVEHGDHFDASQARDVPREELSLCENCENRKKESNTAKDSKYFGGSRIFCRALTVHVEGINGIERGKHGFKLLGLRIIYNGTHSNILRNF